MKKIIMILLIIVLISTQTISFASEIPENVIDIYVNGKLIENYYDNQRPFFDSMGRLQCPLRQFGESLGYSIIWNNQDKTVTIPVDDKKIVFQLYSNKLINLDGSITTMDSYAVTVSDRMYAPLRYIAEALGWTVTYKKNNDNSPTATTRATHIINVDKAIAATSPISNDGLQLEGVRVVTESTDLSNNPYLVSFMEQNYDSRTYRINGAGIVYSPYGTEGYEPSTVATIGSAVIEDSSGWQILLVNLQDGKERPILLAQLKVLTENYQPIYDEVVRIWITYNHPATAVAAGDMTEDREDWKVIGKTKYQFLWTGSRMWLRIKAAQ